ncbi:MAG: hypothetical protein M0R50_09170 [Candidatus Cloacimonetes bacterium]|jgi:hypothetical protein|nr:hypothetical protein [Candidatus Cloacimonadota bacterium]
MNDEVHINKTMGELLNQNICLVESCEGEVIDISSNYITLALEVDDELVEQSYSIDQFIKNRLPKKGDRIGVIVQFIKLPPKECKEHNHPKRKNVVELPREF